MVENFISYLIHQPSDSTSPLFLELNTADMLTALGSPDSGVHVYDVNASEANLPYVKLYDNGGRQRMATFLGGSYQEKQTLTVDCVVSGLNPLSATNRAELLKMAVEGEIKKLQSSLAGLTVRTDLGGTSSTENVSAIQIGSVDREQPVTGDNNKYIATRRAIIEIWVFKNRKA